MAHTCTRRVATAASLVALLGVPALSLASEAKLQLPDMSSDAVKFFGLTGHDLLLGGLVICALGLVFGMIIYKQLKNMPVHRSMLEVSELIYETCKTYLLTQGKFLLILELFIGATIIAYFGFLADYPYLDADGKEAVQSGFPPYKVATIIVFSLIGIAGSYGVAWFGIRVNTFANSRTAFASLEGRAYPCYSIPLRAGMSIGMVLISVELLIMLCIILFIERSLAGPCFIGFAIGESLGAAALRVAGGIFTKIADIGADLMKIVFNVKEDDARNPGVIADCTGDNAGDSVGPTADGFETYGVTGVALISFILLAIPTELLQIQLLVWIFVMRLLMVVTSGAAYLVNEAIAKARYGASRSFNYEVPLTTLVWIASVLSVAATYVVSYLLLHSIDPNNPTVWWKLATIITCGTLAGAIIPEMTKVFTSVHSRHVREVVTASREGGASLNILSGLTAGNFSAFWIGGITIAGLMAIAYGITVMDTSRQLDLSTILPNAPAVFAFGLVAFGFLGMGPVTIAVDSYGPVTDNAQSVYELSLIETLPDIRNDLQTNFKVTPEFEHAKMLLEENDGAGNTFKASAKPVLIGTAVVGATTMIFSLIISITDQLKDLDAIQKISIMHAPFLLGLIVGPAIVYWFTGASCQAVITGAYRAVEFIKRNMNLDSTEKASTADSKRVVEICTKYAQAGMFNIFVVVFFSTLAAAFAEEYFFIGFLVGVSISGLFQAVFMANAGGAWDNAKKIVETELREKGTELHAATVVGDTVGDPFKDTSSVALNPIIKFTTLFGLLAVELGIQLTTSDHSTLRMGLSIAFTLVALAFVYRSFYGMRIHSQKE